MGATTETGAKATGKTGVSEKQLAANRANAQRSTGPRTQEGKMTSSQNAIKHAQHVVTDYPIVAGALREDPAAFEAAGNEFLEGLKPRDALERAQALRVIAAFRRNERLDRFEAAALADDGRMDEFHRMLVPDVEVIGYLIGTAANLMSVIEEDLDAGDDWCIELRWDEDDDDPELIHWQDLAKFIRYQGPDKKVGVKGIWTGKREPRDPDEWRKAYKALVAHHWDDREAFRVWAHKTWQDLIVAQYKHEGRDVEVASKRALNGTLEKTAKLRNHSLHELTLALATYEQLQKRPLASQESRNEPIWKITEIYGYLLEDEE